MNIIPETPRIVGNLNIYTMKTGDGRDLELSIVDDCLVWRRVNDTKWVKLVPLEELKGNTPVKGQDYWTPEDIEMVLNTVESKLPFEELEGKINDIVSDKQFVHTQRSSSDSWNIVHNLNKYPSVTVVDSANNVVVGDVFYTDMNTLSIKFKGSFSGKAFIN